LSGQLNHRRSPDCCLFVNPAARFPDFSKILFLESYSNFTTTAGSHTLKFVGLNPLGGDNTAFIDRVEINVISGPADVKWLVADQLGTPRIIVDLSGTLVNTTRHDYLPFGEEIGGSFRASGFGYAAEGVRQQFTGYEKDKETGLDFAQARYYANVQGRFTSPDPLLSSGDGVDPQTWNRYSYVGNHPTTMTDPTGLIWGVRYLGNNRWELKWFEGDTVPSGWTPILFDISYIATTGKYAGHRITLYRHRLNNGRTWLDHGKVPVDFNIWRDNNPYTEFLGTMMKVYETAFTVATGAAEVYNMYSAFKGFVTAKSALQAVKSAASGITENSAKIYENKLPQLLADELRVAESLGVKAMRVGEAGFAEAANAGTVKWVVTAKGELLVVPKYVNGQEIAHSVLSGGGAVSAAGEAEIAVNGSQYFLIDITEK